MKAVVINSYGSPEVLQYAEIDRPKIGADQLLVKVSASSVNPVDWKTRRGDLQMLSGFSFPKVLGSDLSGVVVEVGQRVQNFQPGDEVYTFVNPLSGGAYAEYVAVSADSVALKPQNLSHAQAAAVPIAGLTAFQSLMDLGQMRPGQKVLINGASGGVGTFAVQIAKAFQARVTGVCSAKNARLVEGLGCDRVLDYTEVDFTQQPEKYDIIFDAVGKSSFAACEKVLAPQGVYISTLPTFDNIGPSLASLFFPGKKAKLVMATPSPKDLNALRELIESGSVEPIIDRTYPLEQIAEAHAYSETQRAVGKIAVTVEEETINS